MGAELSGTSTSGSTTSTGSTGAGGACGPEEFKILEHCYHRVDVPDLVFSQDAVVADFDGDTATDLATTCEGDMQSFALCVFAANAGSTVVRTDLSWIGGPSPTLSAADFDDDGSPEILVSTLYHFAVFSLEAGSLVQHSELVYDFDTMQDPADAYIHPTWAVDLDADGSAEVVAGSGFNGLRVWRFDAISSAWVPSGDRHSLFGCGDVADGRVADLDGDTVPEFVALGSHNNCDANMQPGSGWNRVSVFTADGVELVPSGDFAAEMPASKLEIGDFDGDAIPDLVVAGDENMMVFRGVGDRTFDKAIPVPGLAHFTGTGPHAADINLDGFDEGLVQQADGTYHLLMGLPEPGIVPMPQHIRLVMLLTDVDDDGRPDFVSRTKGMDGKFHVVLTLSGTLPML